MLKLTRRVGESLIVGAEISVVVLRVKGGQVQLGVDAPRDISVHREEIYERLGKKSPSAKIRRRTVD